MESNSSELSVDANSPSTVNKNEDKSDNSKITSDDPKNINDEYMLSQNLETIEKQEGINDGKLEDCDSNLLCHVTDFKIMCGYLTGCKFIKTTITEPHLSYKESNFMENKKDSQVDIIVPEEKGDVPNRIDVELIEKVVEDHNLITEPKPKKTLWDRLHLSNPKTTPISCGAAAYLARFARFGNPTPIKNTLQNCLSTEECIIEEFSSCIKRDNGLFLEHYSEIEESNLNDRKLVPLSPKTDPNVKYSLFLPDLPKFLSSKLTLDCIGDYNLYSNRFQKIETLECNIDSMGIITGGLNPLDATDYKIGSSILRFDPLNNGWQYYGPMPEPRNYHTSVYWQNRLYIIGGYSPFLRKNGEMLATSTIFYLNLVSNKWRRGSSMITARASHASGVINDTIYVLGGRDNRGRILSTVESYFPETDCWEMISVMPEPIMGCGFACDGENIWMIGGITWDKSAHSTNYLDTVYKYSPNDNNWGKEISLQGNRAFCSAVFYKTGILLAGGCTWTDDEIDSMASVDYYDIKEKQWEQQGVLNIPRHGITMFNVNDIAILFGGISSNVPKDIDSVVVIENFNNLKGSSFLTPIVGCSSVVIPSKC